MKILPALLLMCFSFNGFSQKSINYPTASKQDISDTLWGHEIPDPYRWLENMNSDQTLAWLADQKMITEKEKGRNYQGLKTFLPVYYSIKTAQCLRMENIILLIKLTELVNHANYILLHTQTMTFTYCLTLTVDFATRI